MNLNNSISNIKNNYFLYLYNKKKSLIKYKKKILNFYIYKFLNIIPNFDALKIKLDEKFDKDPNLLNFYQKFLYLKAYNNWKESYKKLKFYKFLNKNNLFKQIDNFMNLKICRINKKSTKKNLENLNFFFIRQTADKKGKKSLFKLLSMKSKYLKFRFFRGFLNAKYTLKSKKNDPFFSFILSNKNNYFYFFII